MKQHQVLVLEDSLSDQLSIEMILDGFPSIHASYSKNSAEFLEKIADINFKLVIADIELNEALTGLDLVKFVPDPNTWVIIYSIYPCQDCYEQYKSLNFSKFYLQKPLDEFTFKTYIQSFLLAKSTQI